MRIVYLFFGLICLGCSTGVDSVEESTELNGEILMEKHCYSCHNTQGTDNMLAPPMSRVRDHYMDETTPRSEFISAIVDWVENPVDSLSRMHGAKRKFGLMPKQIFDHDELVAIAEHLYDSETGLASCSH